jgi:multidrug efflux system membrane fusion protein
MNPPFPPRTLSLVLGVAFCICAGCGGNRAARAPAPVRAIVVSSADEMPAVRYAATVAPRAEVSLIFKSGGYVEAMARRTDASGRERPLEAGDAIKAGEPLASLRQGDFADLVAQAEGQSAQARAAFDRAEADFKRAGNLLATASLTQSQFDAFKAARDSCAAALKSADALLSQARTARADSTLRAPFDGWIVQRNIETGALAGPSVPAFVVADTRTVKVTFGVSDTIVAHLSPAQSVSLSTASLAGPLTGEITAISSSADPRSRLFSIEAIVPNDDGRLKPGMVATIMLDSATDAVGQLTVPLSAVVRSTSQPGGFAVYVVSDTDSGTVARERQVSLGQAIGNRVAVVDGLKPGERIVSLGTTDLADGDAVAVLP